MKARAVFDCVVFLQAAARKSSPAGACLDLVKQGTMGLCLSPEVLAEVTEVLTRPRTRQKFKTLTPGRVAEFLEDVRNHSLMLTAVPGTFSYPRDPDDEPYVNLAVAAGASYLVTRDKDLLDLMRDDLPEGQDFRQRFPDLTILDPVALLQALSVG